MALTGLNAGLGRALPAAEACGRLSHDSLYAGTQESNRIPTWCPGDAWGGGSKFSHNRRQASCSTGLGVMFAALGPLADYPSLLLCPFGTVIEGTAAITIWITSFPYLTRHNCQGEICGIALQCDGSGGWVGGKSATLHLQALLG